MEIDQIGDQQIINQSTQFHQNDLNDALRSPPNDQFKNDQSHQNQLEQNESSSSSSSSDSEDFEEPNSQVSQQNNILEEIKQIELEAQQRQEYQQYRLQRKQQQQNIQNSQQEQMQDVNQASASEQNQQTAEDLQKAQFEKLRNEAKQLFNARKYQQAYEIYQKSDAFCVFRDEKSLTYNNMAMCSLKLQKNEEAFRNIQMALRFQRNAADLNPEILIKIKFRLGSILSDYLRDYKQSRNILKQLKKYCNIHNKNQLYNETNQLFEKQSEFINNVDCGKFRLKTIIENYNPENPNNIQTRVADYINEKLSVKVLRDQDQNFIKRGLFANKKINEGEYIVVNQAFIIQQFVGTSTQDKIVEQLDRIQRNNPVLTTLQLNYLAGGPMQDQEFELSIFNKQMTDFLLKNQDKQFFLLSRDQLKQIVSQNILITNQHPYIAKQDLSNKLPAQNYLLFKSANLINHSCVPNCSKTYIREDSSVIFVKAIRDIQENEEITISYLNDTELAKPYGQRKEILFNRWGFKCECTLCKYQLQNDENLKMINQFVSRVLPQNLTEGIDLMSEEKVKLISEKILQLLQDLDITLLQINESPELYLNGTYYQTLYTLIEFLLSIKQHMGDIPNPQLNEVLITQLFDVISKKLLTYLDTKNSKFQSISKLYPQLLCNTITLLYSFKAHYQHYNSSDNSREDDKLCSRWEAVVKQVHPIDWYEDQYMFNEILKRVYERYNEKDKEKTRKQGVYNIDDMMTD
ncbi:SET domain protein [Oxytricha trifallax]|uniref:SET domain protein n=1 Tax=Oxytricha trifallax TaxID=1172189 RepID=A0A073ICH0_9SPIT|nr:SET domain protein [Oxytricha trifallax]